MISHPDFTLFSTVLSIGMYFSKPLHINLFLTVEEQTVGLL